MREVGGAKVRQSAHDGDFRVHVDHETGSRTLCFRYGIFAKDLLGFLSNKYNNRKPLDAGMMNEFIYCINE